jgi:hypothetical protein
VTHRSTVSQHGLSCRVGAALAHLAGGRHRAHAPGPIGHPASLRSHTCRCRALQIPPIATTRPHRRRRVTRTGTQGRRTRARRPRYLSPFTFLVESRRSRSPARQVRANTYVLLRPPVRASAVPLANTDCTSSNSPRRGLAPFNDGVLVCGATGTRCHTRRWPAEARVDDGGVRPGRASTVRFEGFNRDEGYDTSVTQFAKRFVL